MRCIAIIEAERPGLDSAIIWEDGSRLIAFAYLNGRVQKTLPVEGATTLDNAIFEVRQRFQITEGQLTRVHDLSENVAQQQRIVAMPRRWGG